VVPSIQKTAERKARYAAITDAFDCRRGAFSAYCDCWLQAEDWLRIICSEYDLVTADINFTASDIYQALNKGKFRLATTSFPSQFLHRYAIKTATMEKLRAIIVLPYRYTYVNAVERAKEVVLLLHLTVPSRRRHTVHKAETSSRIRTS
jgi:hypothetical protein